MARCLIGLGSNLGDCSAQLSAAVSGMERDGRLRLIANSACHETRATGGPAGQKNFLNAAVLVETVLQPPEVLDLLMQIENRLGRDRKTHWGPRTLDLDLLLYDELAVQSESLVLPHPRMAWRRFVLAPAAEIAGEMLHPGTGWTIARLLRHLNTSHNYAAVAGSIGVGKTWLSRRAAEKTSARFIAERLDSAGLQRFYADPSGIAGEMELKFLRERARMLSLDSEEWSDRSKPAVSDFWFDQSAAFAAVWLGGDDLQRFLQQWEAAREAVVQPRLTVLIAEPENYGERGEWLLERVRRRGRSYERGLTAELLHKIELAVVRRFKRPDLGPVLRLSGGDPQAALEEIAAAIEAMQ